MRHSVITEDVAQTIQAKKTGGHSLNYMPAAMVPRSYATDAFAVSREGVGTLRANGGDAGQGSETLVVTVFTERTRKDGRNLEAQDDVAYALTNPGDGGRTQENRVVVPAPLAFAQNTRDEVRKVNGDGAISGALAAQPGAKQTTYVAIGIRRDHTPKIGEDVAPSLTANLQGGNLGAVAYHRNASCAVTAQDDVTAALRAEGEHSYQFIKQKMAVRRLTPKEDERLMGWPDDHTRWGADGTEMSDSTRYKMCGNGVVAPVAAWIARRIAVASR